MKSVYLFIHLFIYLFTYFFIYLFCAQAEFLASTPLLKPLKMNSSEFLDIFERAR